MSTHDSDTDATNAGSGIWGAGLPPDPSRAVAYPDSPYRTVRLGALARTRSGDKGNHANLAVFAHNDQAHRHLEIYLTAERVAQFFGPLGVTRVIRYSAPLLRGWNFLLENALGGGASQSLRWDSQGKALGEIALAMELPAGPERSPRADAHSHQSHADQ